MAIDDAMRDAAAADTLLLLRFGIASKMVVLIDGFANIGDLLGHTGSSALPQYSM